jgi:hypothetical protein
VSDLKISAFSDKSRDFKGKHILFFAPKFFGYETAIKEKLEELGAKVDFFDDRPSNSTWVKSIIRLNRRFVHIRIHKYFSQIISNLPFNGYDFVFFIKMESMPRYLLEKLKITQSKAQFIYYSHDSVKNNPNALACLDLFDKVFTFDRHDAENRGMKFRPLFFLDIYRHLPSEDLQYDWCFIGTAHSDRYKLVKDFSKATKAQQLHGFVFLYVPSQLLFWMKKVFSPRFWKAKLNEFSFGALSKKDVINYLAKSKVILDFQHPKQTGLTMRTIEMLGAKKKLITTNQDIQYYDFYRPENIMVINRSDIKIDKNFFDQPYCAIDAEIYEKYSIEGWLNTLFWDNVTKREA